MSARDVLIAALRQGTRGTCAEIAAAVGIPKVTVYVVMRELEREGLAVIVAEQRCRGGKSDIFAGASAERGVQPMLQDSPAVYGSMVQKALASRSFLDIWPHQRT